MVVSPPVDRQQLKKQKNGDLGLANLDFGIKSPMSFKFDKKTFDFWTYEYEHSFERYVKLCFLKFHWKDY